MAKVIFDDALKGAYSDISVGQQSEETVDYKQVTTLGVESLVAAVFGILGFFWTPFILASLLGLTLGFLAHRKIMKAPEETSGGTMTTVAMILSGVLFVTSLSWQVYSYYVSAPPGYQILPFDDMALTKDGDGNTATLTCLAPSAQSYEWYEDGVRMPGETSDSLTLNWERAKAKPNNHTHTYSVKPVYTVFNEKVLGDAATATVEYTPQGMVISIQ